MDRLTFPLISSVYVIDKLISYWLWIHIYLQTIRLVLVLGKTWEDVPTFYLDALA